MLFDRAGSRGDDAATYYREKNGRHRTVKIDKLGDIVDDFGEYEVHVYRIALSRKHKDSDPVPEAKK